MELEKAVADLAHKIERRFYGKYRGFVVSSADPKCLGRLRLQVPSVLGPDVVTGWAMPCLPYGGQNNQGLLCIPEEGAGVWVEFEEGDLEFPIWVGTFWSEPGGESEWPKLNDADGKEQINQQKPPTRKIIKTKKGHTIQLEDKDNEEMVTIIQRIDGQRFNIIVMDKDGMKLVAAGDMVIAGQNITLEAEAKLTLKGNPVHLNP